MVRPLATASFITKCTILYLGRNNTHHHYSVNNVSLPDVTVVTDLGVLVDNNLRFTKHYRSIVRYGVYMQSTLIGTCRTNRNRLLVCIGLHLSPAWWEFVYLLKCSFCRFHPYSGVDRLTLHGNHRWVLYTHVACSLHHCHQEQFSEFLGHAN